MKYHNTSGRKRQTKKRGGTTSTNGKREKVVKTLKQQSAKQAATRTQDNQHRITAIINRIRQYNDANPEERIAEKYGVRALTSKKNTHYTNEQLTDPYDSNYLNDTELYKLYVEYKKVIAERRKQLRHITTEGKNLRKKSVNNEVNKERISPVASLIKPFTDPDGNPSDYPFSDKKYVDKRELNILYDRHRTSPQYLFDLDNILKTPPKTPPINYGDDYDVIDGMFDTPKKSPKK